MNPGVSNVSCCGFNATKGWDPMTGSGTPNYEELVKLAVQ
jgi:hypothetical protein